MKRIRDKRDIKAEERTDPPWDPAALGAHVTKVLEAADGAAAEIVNKARAESERQIGEAKQRAQRLVAERQRRMEELSDDLMSQAEAIGSGLAALDEALGAAIERLRRELERLPEVPEGEGEPKLQGDGEPSKLPSS